MRRRKPNRSSVNVSRFAPWQTRLKIGDSVLIVEFVALAKVNA